eukprot:TRINITY_DN25992_c0_g6_i1.p1 TRINITY_DN25992_c0_g6~~TRINITY_DN25992_c0_g6_i1.p1  ORF type:complete len:935 (+),score=215.17 TRINITY_DN25992_c0_g6_i1:221-3025(+)
MTVAAVSLAIPGGADAASSPHGSASGAGSRRSSSGASGRTSRTSGATKLPAIADSRRAPVPATKPQRVHSCSRIAVSKESTRPPSSRGSPVSGGSVRSRVSATVSVSAEGPGAETTTTTRATSSEGVRTPPLSCGGGVAPPPPPCDDFEDIPDPDLDEDPEPESPTGSPSNPTTTAASVALARPNVPEGKKVFILCGGYPHIRTVLTKRGWVENTWDVNGTHFDLKWSSFHSVDFGNLVESQLVNHCEKISHLTTKCGLDGNLSAAGNTLGIPVDSFYPRTFHLSSPAAFEAFTSEFKLQKVTGILKEWVKHNDAKPKITDTFSLDVVNLALTVAKRHVQDIDDLLDADENEAEVSGAFLSDAEWAVIDEVDMRKPADEPAAMQTMRQAQLDHERAKGQTKLAKERQIAQLQQLKQRRDQKAAKRQQERERKDSARRKLSRAVLGSDAEARLLRRCSTWSSSRAGATSAVAGQDGGSGGAAYDADSTQSPAAEQSAKSADVAITQARADELETDAAAGPAAAPAEAAALQPELCASELLDQARDVLAALRRASPQYGLNGTRDIWILKPAGRSRGLGIFCSNSLEPILHCAKREKETTTWICQKYIENPLLLKGRKHDIRQWVLVTSWNPLKIYFYGEAYVRLAASTYDGDVNLANNMSHLTNNAIACHHPQFDKEDEYWRCMWDDDQYSRFLREQFGFNAYRERVVPAMKKAVIATFTAVQDPLSKSRNPQNCFELLGLDFMVDDELNVWLLEVNLSPSMEYSTSITARMVPEVLEDALAVLLDGEGERFELIHSGTEVAEAPCGSALASLVVEGKPPPQLRPARPAAPATPPREVAQRLSDRRLREIEAVAERQRLKGEKLARERERKANLKRSLSRKILQGRTRSAAVEPGDVGASVDVDIGSSEVASTARAESEQANVDGVSSAAELAAT